MSLATRFKFDLSEKFPHLSQAPIVEAVIHWRARADKTFQPQDLLEQLKQQLPDYPTTQTQQELKVEAQIGPEGAAQTQRAKWHGFRVESEDKLHVAQFSRNGFVFSRLTPYLTWDNFETEAFRLWHMYCNLAEVSEVQRLDVRFINRISLNKIEEVAAIVTIPPKCTDELQLPLEGFMHQTRYEVPGQPYNINVIQTIQPPVPAEQQGLALILDIDVFTTTALKTDDELIKERLAEMRWLKNKTFFTFLTKDVIASFQGESR